MRKKEEKLELFSRKIEDNPTDVDSLLEDAFLDFVEVLCAGMRRKRMNKEALAKALGKHYNHVTMLLGGTRINNLSLRTMVEALRVVGKKLVIKAEDLKGGSTNDTEGHTKGKAL